MFSFLPFSFERSWYQWWSSFSVLFRLFLFITLVMSRKLIMRFKFHYRLSIARNLSKFRIIAYWFSLILKLIFYYKLYILHVILYIMTGWLGTWLNHSLISHIYCRYLTLHSFLPCMYNQSMSHFKETLSILCKGNDR